MLPTKPCRTACSSTNALAPAHIPNYTVLSCMTGFQYRQQGTWCRPASVLHVFCSIRQEHTKRRPPAPCILCGALLCLRHILVGRQNREHCRCPGTACGAVHQQQVVDRVQGARACGQPMSASAECWDYSQPTAADTLPAPESLCTPAVPNTPHNSVTQPPADIHHA
jgi:hypothetical protein